MDITLSYDLSVVVICTNVRAVIQHCDQELTAVLSTLGLQVELIYVDNGSLDDTLFQLRNIVRSSPAELRNVQKRVISLRQKYNQMTALIAALDHSSGKAVLTIDPYLTVDPICITSLLAELEQGYDIVIGRRRRDHLRYFVQMRSRLVNMITSLLTGVKLHDYGSPIRLIQREILDAMPLRSELYHFLPVFGHNIGARIIEVPIPYRADRYIGWEYTPNSVLHSFWDLVTLWFLQRYSRQPLYLFGNLGLLFILASVVVLVIAFVNRITTSVSLIETPLPTLSGILLVVGIQTILLGLTTELIVRTYIQSSIYSPYHLRKVYDADSAD